MVAGPFEKPTDWGEKTTLIETKWLVELLKNQQFRGEPFQFSEYHMSNNLICYEIMFWWTIITQVDNYYQDANAVGENCAEVALAGDDRLGGGRGRW